MVVKEDLEILAVESQAAWETWLDAHHGTSPGVWLKLIKKGSTRSGPTYAEAVEIGLCFGWIDGQGNRYDDDHWLQRFTPRTRRSRWSKINRDKAVGLIESGKMRAAGLAQVERARADGRWDAAYDAPSSATVPDDLRQALAKNPRAEAFFASLDSGNRYAVVYRIQDAKKPETRARRIEKYVAMLGEGQRIHP
jgi:uncharacterized protein YdeI (YjbR/CyaY-like superfamily)